MSFLKFKTSSRYVGRRHISEAVNFRAEATELCMKFLVRICNICNRKQSWLLTITQEKLRDWVNFLKQ